MPEMPEIRIVAKDMNHIIKGKTFAKSEVLLEQILKNCSPCDLNSHLKEENIKYISNIGKWIVFYLSNKKIILSHLRMTGRYYFFQTKPNKNILYTRIIFKFTDGSELHYVDPSKFGTIHIQFEKTFLFEKPLLGLAKEPQETNPLDFWNSLQKTKRAIKSVILDQRHVLGFGNIYVDETLWKISIHPETPANRLSLIDAEKILSIGAKIMDSSTKLGGSSTKTYGSVNLKPGKFYNYLKVFGRHNEPCKRCNHILFKKSVNGRGTTFCPKCQIKI